ncbi:S ribonuclease [Pyrus ussuriensis x Pyrus communis]|uniref:S ribonuclease n=1 Tax=Pyrus ussuriensis x Pyrus communis TaxID=2448454 RepID=A0A5N5HLC2_9ROSA|nr:S ribonuclease [Pyrus ussuriensis x Pyrus communis]
MTRRFNRDATRSGKASLPSKAAYELDESQHEGQHQESQENLDEYVVLDIKAAFYALGEPQKEIDAFVNELKNLTLKPKKKAVTKPACPGKILLKRSQLLLLTRALIKHHPLSLKKMLLPYWKRSCTRALRVGGMFLSHHT